MMARLSPWASRSWTITGRSSSDARASCLRNTVCWNVPGRIFLPVVVQADLPDGHHLGPLAEAAAVPSRSPSWKPAQSSGWTPHGGVHMAGTVSARATAAREEGRSHPGSTTRPTPSPGMAESSASRSLSKRSGVIMGMGIKNRHNPLPRSFFVPVYTESAPFEKKNRRSLASYGFLELIPAGSWAASR